MRSAGAGLFGALLMVAPLVAIPIFAVVGVPQFAPAISPSGDQRDEAEPFDDTPDSDEFDESPRPTASRSRPSRTSAPRTTKRRAADDLYAPLPEPVATDNDRTETDNSAALPWRDESTTELPELSDRSAPRRPRDPDGLERTASLDTESTPTPTPTPTRPARKQWSNTPPRGSLGEWEFDESTGAPARDSDEPLPPTTRPSEIDEQDEAPEWDPSRPQPLTEAGAINFLARGTPARKPAPSSRTAEAPSTRAAPRRGGRPIPTDDDAVATLDAELPELSDPVSPRRPSSHASNHITTADAELGTSDLESEDSISDDETDRLSEIELQRGLASDPLSARTRSPKAPGRTTSMESNGGLDFPEPSAAAFADATPLGADTDHPSPATPRGTDLGNADESDIAAATDSPAVESMTWKQATAQLKTWGIRKYRLEADPETEGFVFVCMAPDPNSTKVTRRFEATGSDPLSTVRSAIGQISDWYASRTRRE